MSVRQRHRVTKSGEVQVRWVADFTDAQGKRRTRTFERKSEAERFHHYQRLAARDAKVSFAGACERWIERRRDEGLQPATIARYKSDLARHVLPFIGRLRLADLTPDTLGQLRDRMIENGKSAATVRRTLLCVVWIEKASQEESRAALRHWTDSDVTHLLPPPPRKGRERLAPGVHFPSREELGLILKAATLRDRAFISVGCLAGLRPSELIGLVWIDINLEAAVIKVRRYLWRGSLSQPLSTAAYRTIPIPAVLVAVLREWELACPVGPDNLVFPTMNGRLMPRHVAVRQFKNSQFNAHKAAHPDGPVPAGAQTYALGSLRQFYAWWCATSPEAGGLGMPPSDLSLVLGHSDVGFTLSLFGHFFENGSAAGDVPNAPDFLPPPTEQ